MADLVYNTGLDGLSSWTTGTYRFLLLKGALYVPSKDHDFVADLVPATNEISGAGYARVTAGTKLRTVDDTLDRITYSCANPAFGSIATGETVTGMVLYRFITNDADSPLIGYYDVVDRETDGNPFTVPLSSLGIAYLDAA